MSCISKTCLMSKQFLFFLFNLILHFRKKLIQFLKPGIYIENQRINFKNFFLFVRISWTNTKSFANWEKEPSPLSTKSKEKPTPNSTRSKESKSSPSLKNKLPTVLTKSES